jgi:hypothetical protein
MISKNKKEDMFVSRDTTYKITKKYLDEQCDLIKIQILNESRQQNINLTDVFVYVINVINLED